MLEAHPLRYARGAGEALPGPGVEFNTELESLARSCDRQLTLSSEGAWRRGRPPHNNANARRRNNLARMSPSPALGGQLQNRAQARALEHAHRCRQLLGSAFCLQRCIAHYPLLPRASLTAGLPLGIAWCVVFSA